MDERIFFEIFSKNPKEIYNNYLESIINYLNNSSEHKTHRITKFKEFLKLYVFSKNNLNLIFEQNLNKENFRIKNQSNFNLFIDFTKYDLYETNLLLFKKDNLILSYTFDDLFYAIIFNIINSKNSFILKDEFILNKYSLVNNLQNYFNLLLYSLIMNTLDYDEIKSIKIMDEYSDCFEEILLDWIILFENQISYEKKISFKEISSKDLSFLNTTFQIFEEINKKMNVEMKNLEKSKINFFKKLFKNKSKLDLFIGNLDAQVKLLEKNNEHIDPIHMKQMFNFISEIKKLVKTIKKNILAKKPVIELLILWSENIKELKLSFSNDISLEISKINFLIKKGNLSSVFSIVLSLFIKIFKMILAKFKLFSSSLPMFKPPYNLNNINISTNVMVVRKEIKNVLSNHSKWYRTMILSNNPLFIIKIYPTFWVKTNCFPNNTFGLFSIKKNKINNILSDKNGSQLKILQKLNRTCFNINHQYLENINTLIKSLEIIGPNSQDQENIILSFIDSDEINILKKFLFLVKEYNLKKIYLPWYFDSRMRIYSYSVFAPTAGRIMRGLLEINYENDLDDVIKNESETNLFFDELKDEAFIYFFKQLILLDSNTFKNILSFETLSQKDRINIKLFVIAIANRYWNDNSTINVPTHYDLLNNLLVKIKENKIKLISFLILFSEDKNKIHLGSYNQFFIELFIYFKNSKADVFEELLILYNFSRILFSKERFFIQFDVSSSALVLCGLILKFKTPELLNITNNNFIKRDAYNTLANKFKELLNLNENDSSLNHLINRNLFKKPSMTIMYGSGEKNTIAEINKYLKIWDLKNDDSNEDSIDNYNQKKYFLLNELSVRVYQFLVTERDFSKNAKRYDNHTKKNDIIEVRGVDDLTKFNADNWEDLSFAEKLKLIFVKKRDISYNSELSSKTNLILNPKIISENALELIFYKQKLEDFRKMSVENLLIYGGVIWINGEPVILTYTEQTTRILSTLTQRFIENNKEKTMEQDSADSVKKLTENKDDEPTLKNLKNPIRFTRKKRGLDYKYEKLFILDAFSFEKNHLNKQIIINFLLKLKLLNDNGSINLTIKLSRQLIIALKNGAIDDGEFLQPIKLNFNENELLQLYQLLKILNEQDFERLELILTSFLNELPKFSTAFRANAIHAVDAYIARTMILENSSSMITNHDCFYIKSNDIANSIITYNTIFTNINIKINEKEFTFDESIKNNLPFFI